MDAKKFSKLVRLIFKNATYHNKAAQLWQYKGATLTYSGDIITVIMPKGKEVYRCDVKNSPNVVEEFEVV